MDIIGMLGYGVGKVLVSGKVANCTSCPDSRFDFADYPFNRPLPAVQHRAELYCGSMYYAHCRAPSFVSGVISSSRSKMPALAIPPTSRIVCKPYRFPRCSSPLTSVVMMRALPTKA
jgi:hypothetical protein